MLNESWFNSSCISSRVENQFLLSKKYYRCVCYLNKVWSTNFVNDSEILAVEKMILLANISTSL